MNILWVRAALLTGAASLVLAAFGIDGSAHVGVAGVTWTGTVSRILERRCVTCHSASGGTLPHLDSYDSARAAAQAVKVAVITRRMPRWPAVSGSGDFANDPTLTPYEIDQVADWADGGAPRGDRVIRPPVPERPAGNAPPDLVVGGTSKHVIRDAVHTFELNTGLKDERWIRGWAFRPGNLSLIRSAVVSLASGTTLGTWVPGEPVAFLPDGVALRLPAGAPILLTVYYRRPPGPAVDASGVGLYFSSKPAHELEHLVLPCGATGLPRAIHALAVRPHVGSTGSSLAVRATGRDRRVEPLGLFRDYSGDQPRTYWFRRPVTLERGASIEVASDGDCRAELDYIVKDARSGRDVALGPGRDRGRDDVPAGGPGSAAPEAFAAGYACPMHADIRTEVPGTCPVCSMTLVPNTARVEGKYGLEAELLRAARGGTRRALRLVVREPGTNAVVRQFATVHERPFHLFVVSDDLREFAHVHPLAQPDGSLELASPPIGSGAYQLYADFLPVEGTPQLLRRTIAGSVTARAQTSRVNELVPDMEPKEALGLRVRLQPEPGALVAGKPNLIDFTLADAAGSPLSDLEPFLGAWGHLFIVSADLADAVHSHPITFVTTPDGARIVFRQRFPREGSYRLWAQFQRGGKVATVSFTVTVTASPARGSEGSRS